MWITVPGGGVYPAVWVPAAAAVAALAWRVRPPVARPAEMQWIDLSLIAALMTIAGQLIPLAYGTVLRIDPQAIPLRIALLRPLDTPARVPISIAPGDTIAALGIAGAAVLLFWTCRRICETGGTGRIIRAVAVIGLLASLAAIVQHGSSKELLYGIWRPADAGARPYGPFVNRNHFATWIVMACPLVFGYLLARAPAARERRNWSERVAGAVKQLGTLRTWLTAAVCVMTLAVVISASRSGIIGLAAAFAASALLSGGRQARQTRRWTMMQATLLAAVLIAFANFDSLLARMDETLTDAQAGRGRSAIWRDAGRVIADFRLTGTGAGTFGTAVRPYQTASPGFAIGNAHNHYLQVAAEGGALLAIPCALAIGSFWVLLWRRLRQDDGSTFLVRAGAAAGIAAVMVQSIWETGLRMPANAMLLAVLAAVAVHPSPAHTRRSEAHGR